MEGCIILNATAKSPVWVHLGFPGNADGTVLTKKSVICRTCSQKCHIRQHIILQYIAIYRITRNFRGLKFSRFLWIGSHCENFTLGLEMFCIVTPATQTDTPGVSALYRYFQTSNKSMTLLDPCGPLSRLVPSSGT